MSTHLFRELKPMEWTPLSKRCELASREPERTGTGKNEATAMHDQTIIQNRVVAKPNCATREVIRSSLEGRGCVLGEQNTQSFIDAMQSWLAAREVIEVELLASCLGFDLSEQ